MKNSPSIRFGVASAVVLLGLYAISVMADQASTSVFEKPVPGNVEDLRAIEQAARDVAQKVVPCTVGLQVGAAQGSGVIVTEDGYVLTAAHVIGRPGRDVQVSLPDGTVVRGRTLGIHTVADVGLVKITDKGKWPFAPLVTSGDGPEAGHWCLATGHPDGFQKKRVPPVRLGRVIDVQPHVLRTDCPITGGDSGGPLFDMKGRVIGIHSRISVDATENLHGPGLACVESWEQMEAGQVFPVRPASRFLDQLDIDRDGKITRAELPNEAIRGVFDRLAEQFRLDPKKAHSIDQLVETFGWRTPSIPAFGPWMDREEQIGESLARKRFVRGREILRSFANVVTEAGKSTVRILGDGQQVALGLVVGADGWILTKASQLSGDVECRLADGRRLKARRVGADETYDLALLRIEAKNLHAVEWSTAGGLPPGSWLITPDVGGAVASVGVVSVGERKIERIRGVLGVQIALNDAEARVALVYPDSGAAQAGIRDGDVITHISGKAVRNLNQLKSALESYRLGETIRTSVTRGDKRLKLDVTLGSFDDAFFRFGWSRVNGPLSRRRDDFPQAFQHDSVLKPNLCGGPAVDISGDVVGINIARSDRVATLALRGQAIQPLIERLKSEATSASDNN